MCQTLCETTIQRGEVSPGLRSDFFTSPEKNPIIAAESTIKHHSVMFYPTGDHRPDCH